MGSLAGRVGQWWPGVGLGNTDRGTAVSRGSSPTWLVRVGGTFNWLMGKLVASGGVKPGVEWPATVPGRRGTGFPKARAWGDAI